MNAKNKTGFSSFPALFLFALFFLSFSLEASSPYDDLGRSLLNARRNKKNEEIQKLSLVLIKNPGVPLAILQASQFERARMLSKKKDPVARREASRLYRQLSKSLTSPELSKKALFLANLYSPPPDKSPETYETKKVLLPKAVLTPLMTRTKKIKVKKHSPANLLLAKEARKKNNFLKARQILSSLKKNAKVLNEYTLLYLQEKKYKKAVESSQESIAMAPNHPEFWFNLGIARFKMKNKSGAQKAFAMAAQLDPSFSAARINAEKLK